MCIVAVLSVVLRGCGVCCSVEMCVVVEKGKFCCVMCNATVLCRVFVY